MIVVPAIDLKGGRVVRLVEGDPERATDFGSDPLGVAGRFAGAGAALLHVVDLDAALETGSNRDVVTAICRSVHTPVQLGGGLRTADAVAAAFTTGAARVVVGTAAAVDPGFVGRAVDRHGDRVVAAVDVRLGHAMIRGWRVEGPPVERLIPALDAVGCPRYLVTSIAADGRLAGPDLALYGRVLELTDRPVIASGGVGSMEDVLALASLGLDGVVVGRALLDGTLPLDVVAQEVSA